MALIQSIKQFDEEIQRIRDLTHEGELIFRGQSDSSWNIVSSAYRYVKGLYPALNVTLKTMEFFKSDVRKGLIQLNQYDGDDIVNIENEDEIMGMLQHLGGKSVFIDFSENQYISLYFACEKLACEKHGIVFVMEHRDDGLIYNIDGKSVGEYKKIELPSNNEASKRLKVQYSCFLNPTYSTVIQNNSNIHHIEIDRNCKEKILKELNEDKGINHNSVYPDFWGYMSRQTIDGNTHEFKSIAFREISQTIKDGCASKMNDVLKTLETLSNVNDEKDNSYKDEQRIKY